MITSLAVGRYGRFCNLLFQVAAAIGVARKSGQPYGFPELINHDHKERFGSTEPIDLYNHFVNKFPRLDKDAKLFQNRTYDFGYHDIYLPKGDFDLTGHFQSEKYFSHCIDEVRQAFTMTNEPGPQDLVAIHVRRGDYDNNYHPILKEDYYRPAMAQFPAGTHFMVFSDDMAQAQAIFHNEPHFISFSTGRNYLDDFRLMKNCKGFICANSTFSLMAAILSPAPGKIIVCPRNWFGPAWTIPMPTKDIYPLNSIVI